MRRTTVDYSDQNVMKIATKLAGMRRLGDQRTEELTRKAATEIRIAEQRDLETRKRAEGKRPATRAELQAAMTDLTMVEIEAEVGA